MFAIPRGRIIYYIKRGTQKADESRPSRDIRHMTNVVCRALRSQFFVYVIPIQPEDTCSSVFDIRSKKFSKLPVMSLGTQLKPVVTSFSNLRTFIPLRNVPLSVPQKVCLSA